MLFSLLLSIVLSGILAPQVAEFERLGSDGLEAAASRQHAAYISAADIEANLVFAQAPQIIDRNNLGPVLTARGAIAIDAATGLELWGQNADQRYPIASISKLMAVLVYLENNPDLNSVVIMQAADETFGGTQHIARGERVRVKDLIFTALIASDNNSVEALVRTSGLAQTDFMLRMNSKARELGMYNTNFVEPTGLRFSNIASARDVAILLASALQNEIIADVLRRRSYEFMAVSGRAHKIFSTNKLFGSYLNVIGGKTGFNDESQYNLTAAIKGDQKQLIYVVVLGSTSIDDRFKDAKILADWTLMNYEWPN